MVVIEKYLHLPVLNFCFALLNAAFIRDPHTKNFFVDSEAWHCLIAGIGYDFF